MDPDPYSEYGSGSRKLLNTDPIRIRIHNTGHSSILSVGVERVLREGLQPGGGAGGTLLQQQGGGHRGVEESSGTVQCSQQIRLIFNGINRIAEIGTRPFFSRFSTEE